jgi:enamine deaminase RidA (YjgF/YER057c/UK114 family)
MPTLGFRSTPASGRKWILGALAAVVGFASLVSGQTLPASGKNAPSTTATVQRIPKPENRGLAASVRVPDGPLVFTGQIFASDAAGDARAQTEGALRVLETTLTKGGGDLARVARLNAYVVDERSVAAVEEAVARRFAENPVAFTLVRTPLQVRGALVALEAVGMSSRSPTTVEVMNSNVAILPAGGKIFISGQAERGPDLASAVKATMAGLFRSVEHLGLKRTDIVQVKGFIKPSEQHEIAMREVAASFAGGTVPPTILYEWVSELFTEIEIVVAAKSLPPVANEPITYAWLPWLTKSPRYCHVTHIMPGTPMIFVGAVDGGDANDPRTQMKVIFERLGSVLFEAGSSYRNLAKATYYLAHPTARALLGDIRGVYYDPTRPPAASALNMNGLGYPGRAAMFDIVAVPVK